MAAYINNSVEKAGAKGLNEAKGYGKEALIRYKICKNRVQEFLKKEMHADDIPVESINKRLLGKFYLWIRTFHKIGNNTAIHFMHKFSTVYKMALDYGLVSGNPSGSCRNSPLRTVSP